MILSISWPCVQSNLKLWAEGWLLYCYTNHCWKYNSHNNDEEELNKSVMTLDDHKIAPSLNLSKKVSTIIFQEHKKIVCILVIFYNEIFWRWKLVVFYTDVHKKILLIIFCEFHIY